MIVNCIMSRHKTYMANIQPKTQTYTNGVAGPITYPTSKTVECLFWRGGISSRLISDKFKPDVSATMICRPEDLQITDIPKAARIEILDGVTVIGYFSAFYADDIAGQNQAVMIPLKEFT